MCNDAEQYRRHWASLTDRSPREVYVPKALQDTSAPETAEVFVKHRGRTHKITLNVDASAPGWVSGMITGVEEVTPS